MPLADLTALDFVQQLNKKVNEEKRNQPDLSVLQLEFQAEVESGASQL